MYAVVKKRIGVNQIGNLYYTWNRIINFYSNYTYLAEYEEGTIEGN